jgi:hypothetical protein
MQVRELARDPDQTGGDAVDEGDPDGDMIGLKNGGLLWSAGNEMVVLLGWPDESQISL